MKDFPDRDELDIDELLESVVRDPSKADEVKALLRRRFDLGQGRGATPAAQPDTAADPDDYWDNVPV